MRRALLPHRPAQLLNFLLTVIVGLAGACSPFQPALTATLPPTPLPATPVALATATITNTPIPTLIWRTPTPRPPALPTSTATSCQDDLRIVLDLSREAAATGTPAVAPGGEQVEQGWRVQNTGACIWDTAYTIAFAAPSNPTWINLSPPEALSRRVRPGEMYDIWVMAVAPLTPGVQQAAWELRNGRGQRVGPPLALTLETAALPTTTGQPRARFVAVPSTVQPGEQVALSWSVLEAREVYLIESTQFPNELPVEQTASRFVYPLRSKAYDLRVVYGDDTTETYRVRVEVVNFDPPRIRFFDVQPHNIVVGAECVAAEWETEGRVDQVTILYNGGVIYSSRRAPDGVLNHCPTDTPALYQIIVTGPGGEDTAERRVN